MTSAIIVTHGDLGKALIDTAKTVVGTADNCFALSNAQVAPTMLRDEIAAIIDANPDDDYMLFVDFFGGSCCHACLMVEAEHENVRLISGVNLPMLLAFLNKRDVVPFDALPGVIVERGHTSIRAVDTESL